MNKANILFIAFFVIVSMKAHAKPTKETIKYNNDNSKKLRRRTMDVSAISSNGKNGKRSSNDPYPRNSPNSKKGKGSNSRKGGKGGKGSSGSSTSSSIDDVDDIQYDMCEGNDRVETCIIDLGTQDNLYAPNILSFTASNLPPALYGSTVNITVGVQGDVDGNHEVVEVFDENENMILQFQGEGSHCDQIMHTKMVEVDAYIFNEWNMDGNVTFVVVPNRSVNNGCSTSGGSLGNVKLSYDAILSSCDVCP